MTRVSANIVHPRAWIFSQFAVANIASAILVSSNPTNLVLAGAFQIKFIVYTANMIVPVIVTIIVLFPFLLYIVFADEDLIPLSIKMHELPEESRTKKPVNPNIPNARAQIEDDAFRNDEQDKIMSLEEIMNPFLDKTGAAFGATIMTATLVTLLALNAASQSTGQHAVYWVTLPAAFVQFCWDLAFGWFHREETRTIARDRRKHQEREAAERAIMDEDNRRRALEEESGLSPSHSGNTGSDQDVAVMDDDSIPSNKITGVQRQPTVIVSDTGEKGTTSTKIDVQDLSIRLAPEKINQSTTTSVTARDDNGIIHNGESVFQLQDMSARTSDGEMAEKKDDPDLEKRILDEIKRRQLREKTTVVTLFQDGYRWSRETFPTVTAVLGHLPFKLIPFAFAMFVLVQALVTKGWVPVFAYGWDHWVEKTGTVGAVGGMGFLSVILCNVSPKSLRSNSTKYP